jgi:hypothetical protein
MRQVHTTWLVAMAAGAFLLGGLAVTLARPQEPDEMLPETVLTICHVQAGKEKAFEDVLARTWAIYQREHLVEAQPHLLVQGTEQDGKPFFAEVFTWVSHRAPDHAPAPVQAVWKEMQALCEARQGRPGIDFSEVNIILPKP